MCLGYSNVYSCCDARSVHDASDMVRHMCYWHMMRQTPLLLIYDGTPQEMQAHEAMPLPPIYDATPLRLICDETPLLLIYDGTPR